MNQRLRVLLALLALLVGGERDRGSEVVRQCPRPSGRSGRALTRSRAEGAHLLRLRIPLLRCAAEGLRRRTIPAPWRSRMPLWTVMEIRTASAAWLAL